MALPNNEENPAWDPEEKNKEIPILGISLSELHEEFFKEIEESYEQDHNTIKLDYYITEKNTLV
ncbi:hypothetical protein CROQUDRAFT_99051 [Cronartium quercuum f. sp. fusiforme G11]|uniref:Uncharacterized protein n=1 Tax=Cronartium quercuum f. sp. fusiforme G11 TaxID=708437 RepID=A0A9P6NBH1_9BASI|nr:hypothetical protein CROQUDRAFT_99051 [Cronartium quercuum f. sp. fusiforme G11]